MVFSIKSVLAKTIKTDFKQRLWIPPQKNLLLTSCSTSSLATICNSITTQDTLGSDHFPIITNISGSFTKNRIFVYKLQTTKKDLILLSLKLKETFSILASIISDNLPAAYHLFERHIRHYLYSFFPPKARLPTSEIQRKFPPSLPWWNENCQAAVDSRRIATSRDRPVWSR